MQVRASFLLFVHVLLAVAASHAEDVRKAEVYARLKADVDAVSSINTHDHLRPFDQIPRAPEADQALRQLWATSYFPWSHRLAAWPKGGSFDDWWKAAREGFANGRAASCYRYLLPAFRDLYGVDFDTLSAADARKLSRRIHENSANREWLEMIPSSRIMWGSDSGTAEAIYGATEFTRRCLAEALAEMVLRGRLRETDALRIGRQVMRENALDMFPSLRKRLWRKP